MNHKKILITGGAGFVGHHCVNYILKNTDWDIIILDSLNYAGNMNRIMKSGAFSGAFNDEKNAQESSYNNLYESKRLKFIWHDLRAPISNTTHGFFGELDYCVHFAAESHVDRSLEDSIPFVMANVLGTANLLEYFKHHQSKCKTIIFSCYDEKTKAFTKEGLKTFDQIKRGDIVLTLNPKTRKIEEQSVGNVIIQDYEGDMVRFDNYRIDLLVTPNHRMYQSDMSVKQADNCLGQKTSFAVPNGFDGKKDISKELMYLIGVYLGDGFTAYQERIVDSISGMSRGERNIMARDSGTGRYVVTQKLGIRQFVVMKSWRIFFDIPENDKARKKTEQVLERLGIPYTKQKGKSGEHLYFTSKEWVEFFSQFGRGAHNKFIPDAFLQYDTEYLVELFNGLVDSDGYWETKMFTTVSDQLADNFCELAVKIGYLPNKRKRYSEAIYKGRLIKGYSWMINFANQGKSINPNYISKESYKGKIWCISVKNKNFLVERNGKFAFSGNTDEVFGAAPEGVFFNEEDRFKPSNPYAASKAGQEMISFSFAHAFKLPISILRSNNIIGERQNPEKFIPKTIKSILDNKKVIIHGFQKDLISRHWIHVENIANAIIFLLENAKTGESYNIVGEEKTVIEMANLICETVKQRRLEVEEIQFVDPIVARPGIDKRYGTSEEKILKMGWKPSLRLDSSLKKTVEWTLKNKQWLEL